MADLYKNFSLTSNKKNFLRCEKCGLYTDICICDCIDKTQLDTKLTLLIHIKEINRLTNTGRFANLCLTNSAIFLRGLQGDVWNKEDILPDGYNHRILFPYANEELTPEIAHMGGKPLNLIIPDGTWSQAKKIVSCEPYLQEVRRVKLPPSSPSEYRLRHTENPHHISTLEAIARALGILENAEVREKLEYVFSQMTGKLLKLRGY